METFEMYKFIEDALEAKIKFLKQKLKSKRVADKGMKGQWQNDLFEISQLRKGIGQIKEGFLDRVLPY
jgi:L-cysteine desulfidase